MHGPVRSTIAYRPWHGGLFSLANNSLDCSHSSCQVKPPGAQRGDDRLHPGHRAKT